MPAKRLPERPDLIHLKRQAKDLRAALLTGDTEAIRRVREFHPRFGRATDAEVLAVSVRLADAQLVIAREYGFASWPGLKQHLEGIAHVQRRVNRLQDEFARGDSATRRRILSPAHSIKRFENYDPDAEAISEADARLLIANEEGYAFWKKYESYLHLDPSVQRVISAVRCGDRHQLQILLCDEPSACNPHWVPGYAPESIPNDSIPLFCVSEGSFRGTNTHRNENDLVRDLVQAGADVDLELGTSFIGAVSFNVIGAVEALIDSGAAIDGVDRDGSPLAYALHFGYLEIAEILAARGARLDLRFAAGVGRLVEVKSFFNAAGSLKPDAGALADPYALELKRAGQSAFRCERNRENILSQALYFACLHGRLEVASFLLSQGAEINAIVPGLDFRATVLHRVVSIIPGRRQSQRDVHEIIRFLVEHGADVRIPDEVHNATPVEWARHTQNQDTAELLLSLGASKILKEPS